MSARACRYHFASCFVIMRHKCCCDSTTLHNIHEQINESNNHGRPVVWKIKLKVHAAYMEIILLPLRMAPESARAEVSWWLSTFNLMYSDLHTYIHSGSLQIDVVFNKGTRFEGEVNVTTLTGMHGRDDRTLHRSLHLYATATMVFTVVRTG